jgi:cytochrome b
MQKHLVWDWPVRIFHWLLVLGLFAQWITAEQLEDAMQIHFYVGYFLLGLVLFRLVWGFIGTKYAKFNQGLGGPRQTISYLLSLFGKQHKASIGHNPVGALMLPAVIFLVATQAISGLFSTDDIFYSGPYYSVVSDLVQECMQWLHYNTINLLWAIVAIHLLAIAWYRFKLKQDLVTPMLDGKKVVHHTQAIESSKVLRALAVVALVSLLVCWLVFYAPPIPDFEYY